MQSLSKIIIAVLAAVTVNAAFAQKTTAFARGDALLKSEASWNGNAHGSYPKQTPELTLLKLTMPTHTALPWHYHPYPDAGYVLPGQLTIEDKASGKKQTFTLGQAFTESLDDVHRGISGDTPTVLIITYSGVHGVPTFVAANGGKHEC